MKQQDRTFDLAMCSSDEFIVSKKEIVSIALEASDGSECQSEFDRLEFQDIWEQTVILDWLEPVVHEGQAALLLHCHREK